MPTIAAPDLDRFAADCLIAVGARADDAAVVAHALIAANLAGHDSHGAIRLLNYCDWCGLGTIDPAARPEVVSRHGATAIVDGAWGWGMVAMLLATETAVDLAAEFGVAVVALRRANHIGRVAPYVARVAEAGMVGLAVANANPAVSPFGGGGRVFGTNPIAWGVPRGGGLPPLVHDIATAAVAEGKLRVARAKGEPVAPGVILDAAGEPATDPEDFYAGGSLLPFGAHKGSGLSVLIQILGRALVGADPASLAAHRGGNGPVLIAIDTRPFTDPAAFAAEVDALCAEIRGVPPTAGFAEVLLPGESEERTRDHRLAAGIPVAARTWADLADLASSLGVNPPSALDGAAP